MTETDDTAVGEYPAEWEADVLLADGSTGHLRPVKPDDQQALVEFYSRVSPESKYLRFFAPYPVLTDRDVHRFTHVDYCDRVALILTVGANMVAIGRYDRIDERDAEVAFLVEDSQQGKGVGQLLLEHLAQAARERGISRFVAEVLPQNRRMVQVFTDAGYTVRREFEDGMIIVEFPIRPTDTSREVMLRREHRAESMSVRRLLHPKRVAVVGSSNAIERAMKSVNAGEFTGEVLAVCTNEGGHVEGIENLSGLDALPEGLDIVATLLPGARVPEVIEASAGKAFGMYLIYAGHFGGEENRELVSKVRFHGLRAIGPDALGLINTELDTSLNATPGPMPRRGVVSIFCQSSGVGVILISAAIDRHLGVAQFVSSGWYADVTGNDVMQYWMDDEATKVCLLSLDLLGNPRKFTRIVRQLAMKKPVVLLSPRHSDIVRGPSVGRVERTPNSAVDSMFRQSGIIVCPRRDMMFDVAQLLARQPIPRGERVLLISNSLALGRHMERLCEGHGLVAEEPLILPGQSTPELFAAAARGGLAMDEIDSIVIAVVDLYDEMAEQAHQALFEVATESHKTLIGVFADFVTLKPDEGEADGMGRLPTFSGYTDAIEALALVTAYSRWRHTDHGHVPDLTVDHAGLVSMVAEILAAAPEGRDLTEEESARLLGCYDIDVLPRTYVNTIEEARAAAEAYGWDVVLKATDETIRDAESGSSVFRNLDNVQELEEAWADLGRLVGLLGFSDPEPQRLARPVIQKMVQPGLALVIRTVEDPGFGPVVSLGVSGIASDLLGDVTYRVPPLTSTDAASMVRDLKASPALFGSTGNPPADTGSLEDLLLRLAQLADDIPELGEVVLQPVLASPDSVHVLGAQIRVQPEHADRVDLARSLE